MKAGRIPNIHRLMQMVISPKMTFIPLLTQPYSSNFKCERAWIENAISNVFEGVGSGREQ